MADEPTNAPQVPAPDKVLKGDAGTAATPRAPEDTRGSAAEEALEAVRAMKTGTPEDTEGRTIPMGEPAENPMFQAVAKYFDVQERDFKDASGDLGFILNYIADNVGVRGVEDIDKVFTFLRGLEDRLAPPQEFETRRYQRVYNYLILQEKVDAMNRALRALERSNYGAQS